MRKIISGWIKDYFSDEEAVYLLLLLCVCFAVLLLFGKMLAPVLTSIVISYLLLGAVSMLVRRGLPEFVAIIIVYVLSLGFVVALIVLVLPLAWQQLMELTDSQLPRLLTESRIWLEQLPDQYPDLISAEQAQLWGLRLSEELALAGQEVVSFSLSKLPNLVMVLVYLVLVPVLVFFFLKDRAKMMKWIQSFLPVKRVLLKIVWVEMDGQISNYVRGKALEIVIIGSATYVAFWAIGVQYAALLGLLVGLSVVVPYVGAAVVTVPVAMAGYFQFGWGGWGSSLMTMMLLYSIIQALDGNVLVPILFSEAVNLHPVAIIVAILIFGGIWGFWGVFFAIPLATLVKAVISAWPKGVQREADSAADHVFANDVSDS
ncbi:MAG: AI-2E family transporter [Gammaproteobacteria bacterium]|nr:AI-2E family transporter [Gammaproteobacteria bacterium]